VKGEERSEMPVLLTFLLAEFYSLIELVQVGWVNEYTACLDKNQDDLPFFFPYQYYQTFPLEDKLHLLVVTVQLANYY